MRKHYQLLTVHDLRKDETDILEVLSAMGDGRLSNDIRLLNYYRELPVSFDASIEYLERGVADVRVHELQAAAMMIEKETFIKSRHLEHDVVAKVIRIKKDRHLAVLGYFQYAQITAERRFNVRVQVSEKHEAAFCHGQHPVRGWIEDISYGGVSISVPGETAIEENVTGALSIFLPNATLELNGKLLKVEQGESFTRFVITLELDGKSEQIVSQFIFSQQGRIIRELKNLYLAGPDNIVL